MIFKEPIYPFTNLVDLVLSNNRNVADDTVMFIDADTEESINFGNFKKLVRQTTAGFLRAGLQKGDNVCLYVPNNVSVPSIVLGALGAGASISPTNPLFTPDELEKLLVLSKAKYIVAHPINLDIALQIAQKVGIPLVNVWSICKDPKGRAPEWKEIIVNDQTADAIRMTIEESKSCMAYICFSSGTTGPPKGVMISHHNFIANTIELSSSLKSSQDYSNMGPLLGVVPLFHILGIFRFIHLSVFEGRTSVLMAKYDLEQFCYCIEKYKISALYVVPPMLLHLLNSPSIVEKYNLSSLKSFHVGAAPVSQELAEQVQKKFDTPVYQGYGMTETASVLTYQTRENYCPNSVGRMISGITTKVVDDNGKDLEAGETGEICIKGPIVMQGYLNNPKATAESIDKEGYLHTGDVGYVDKLGNWFIVDRSKELIKYNAYQIAPAELENVLLKCPLISDAAVIGIFDTKRQTEVPRAYIALSPAGKSLNQQQAAEQIHAFVNNQVIQYKRLRGDIEFIDVVPKSVSGKILRKDLRELYKKQQQSQAKL